MPKLKLHYLLNTTCVHEFKQFVSHFIWPLFGWAERKLFEKYIKINVKVGQKQMKYVNINNYCDFLLASSQNQFPRGQWMTGLSKPNVYNRFASIYTLCILSNWYKSFPKRTAYRPIPRMGHLRDAHKISAVGSEPGGTLGLFLPSLSTSIPQRNILNRHFVSCTVNRTTLGCG
jgi:hypothetical protein